jgi:hypothetical protein
MLLKILKKIMQLKIEEQSNLKKIEVGYTSYFKQCNFYISKENVSCSEN